MIYDGNEDIKRAYKQGYADARVAEAEATKERIAATPEPLAPLSDARVRELSNLARNGPDVVAMAQEVALSRERIALLEAERACLRDWARCAHRFAWAHEQDCPRHDGEHACTCGLDAFLARPRMVIDGYHATFREIALALGLSADAAPDAVIKACEALKEIAEQACGEAEVLGYYGDDPDSALTMIRVALAGNSQLMQQIMDALNCGVWDDETVLAAVKEAAKDRERLRQAVAWAYQAVGALWPNQEALDNLSAAMAAESVLYEWPIVPSAGEKR